MGRMAVLAECHGFQLRNRHGESPGMAKAPACRGFRLPFCLEYGSSALDAGLGLLVVIGVFN